MAKSAKSGLGRGLNSLLGGAFEEAAPIESAPKRVLVENEQEEAPRPPRSAPSEPARPLDDASVRITSFPAEGESIVEEGSQVTIKSVVQRNTDEVAIESISPNPDQPRTNFKREELEELAASIEKDGLLQPILVRPLGQQTYQIIAGERRWQACKLAGLKKVPIRIKEADDDRSLELALVENIQRSDLNPIEEAYGYRRLMERCNFTQSEVAQAMSKGRSTVANALRLLELPEEAQQLLFEEKITAGHARAILSIPTKEGRQKLTDKIIADKLTVREAEAIARLMSGKKSESAQPKAPLPKTYKTVARALKDALHTNVRVKSVKGKNKIEIEFKDEEDLERLFEELLSKPS
ncbi:MAG: Nucleoid occlusion protein [Paraeggerthella hongkongensis]|uniref:ParB/RepB/Spo0J family partition protein n=1 Tax=Paraeggerthella sp. TaxID=2897350 RepID=UPI0030E40D61